MPMSVQVGEGGQAMLLDEEDGSQSDGSGHDSEDYLEIPTVAVQVGGGEDMAALLGGIAQLARGMGIMLERISFLEQMVGTVQFDMTWVRDDVKGVHEAMNRFGDYVCDIQDAAADVDRVMDQARLDGSQQQQWKGKDIVVDFPIPEGVSNMHGGQQRGGQYVADGNAGRKEGFVYIQESQALDKAHHTHTSPEASTDAGRMDWLYEHATSPDMGDPPCQQPRVSIEKEPLQEVSQQIEMSWQMSQVQMTATPPSMFTDYSTAVRDCRAPNESGNETDEGWVSAKKARWDLAEYGKENVDTGSDKFMGGHGALNLNLTPEKQGQSERPRGGGGVAVINCPTAGSKTPSGGAWRGTARGKRPPAVQPRYHTSVSASISISGVDVLALTIIEGHVQGANNGYVQEHTR
jgi:hypothetical protein